ncbi:MAG TPA: alternative ribosome rescue aminoacyl-tRNA hydrolase ArfB [Acidimicrobiales bacterium]
MDDVLHVSRSLTIPVGELDVRFSPSGGPGGQHANRAHTRVEVRFDVAGSPSLGPRQRARLLEKLGDEVRVVCDDERSQHRNRAIALERLRARLEGALHIEKPRRATRPSLGAKRRRLDAKKRRGDVKKGRSGSWD